MKKLTGFLAIVLTTSTLTFSTPSKAAVGVIMGNPSVVLGGLAMVGVGAPVLIFGQDLGDIAGVGGLATLLGMIVLDGEQGQTISFNQISTKTAQKLGVTEVQRQSYNAELDQANYLFEEVSTELGRLERPSATDAKKIWANYESMVSADTFLVMKKISRSNKKI